MPSAKEWLSLVSWFFRRLSAGNRRRKAVENKFRRDIQTQYADFAMRDYQELVEDALRAEQNRRTAKKQKHNAIAMRDYQEITEEILRADWDRQMAKQQKMDRYNKVQVFRCREDHDERRDGEGVGKEDGEAQGSRGEGGRKGG